MESNNLEFECVGIKEGQTFPLEHTGRGDNASPAFVINNLSPKARSIAIILEDIKHPLFKNFTHWLIWNIDASDKISANIPAGKRVSFLGNAIQGIGYGWHRYAGPKPPKGKQHSYRFTIYALDCKLSLSANARKKHFLKAAKHHILQQGSLVGKFE